MAESARVPDKIESVRAVLRAARARADRAGDVADAHEVLAAEPGNPRYELHRRMARAHRGTQRRHEAVAELHGRYLEMLRAGQSRAGQPRAGQFVPPSFVGTLAERLGVRDLGLALFADGQWVAADGATARARAAQDLEYTLGEGPIRETETEPVRVGTPEQLRRRWPRYGAALTALGARSVRAAPIASAGTWFGAVLVLDGPPDAPVDPLTELADEVVLSLLLASESADPDSGLGGHPSLDEAGDWARLHQAAGIVSVCQRCAVNDALDLLRARAYADDIPITQLADRVIGGSLTLD